MVHIIIRNDPKRESHLRLAATDYANRKHHAHISFSVFLIALLEDDPDAIKAKNKARRLQAVPRHALHQEEVSK